MQYTLCPHCLSSLQITAQQLKQKEGLIRCGHCDEVFNALSSPTLQQPTNNNPVATPTESTEQLAPWESLEDRTAKNKTRPYHLITVLLGVVLIAQAIYQNTPWISQNLYLQPQLKQLNKALNLQIPLYQELSKIHVVERQLSDHPHSEQALRLNLSIKNTALIEQAYPTIHLLLSSSNGDKIAHISFNPSDYLSQENSRLFAAQSIQGIELSFDQPQTKASGFEISFSQ